MDPFIQEVELHEGHQRQHAEKDDGEGRSVIGVKIRKRTFKNIKYQQIAGVVRPALGKYLQMVDQFKGIQYRIDHDKHGGGHQERKQNPAKIVPAGRTLQSGRLFQLGWDVL